MRLRPTLDGWSWSGPSEAVKNLRYRWSTFHPKLTLAERLLSIHCRHSRVLAISTD
jgi:hypothetical protein